MWDYLYENCRDLPLYISILAIIISVIKIVMAKTT